MMEKFSTIFQKAFIRFLCKIFDRDTFTWKFTAIFRCRVRRGYVVAKYPTLEPTVYIVGAAA